MSFLVLSSSLVRTINPNAASHSELAFILFRGFAVILEIRNSYICTAVFRGFAVILDI